MSAFTEGICNIQPATAEQAALGQANMRNAVVRSEMDPPLCYAGWDTCLRSGFQVTLGFDPHWLHPDALPLKRP